MELVVNVVASLWLMKSFGLIGIVWGTWIAFAFEKIVLLLFVQQRYRIGRAALFNQRVLLLYAGILFLAFMTSKWIFGL
jgi:hypothetical protein